MRPYRFCKKWQKWIFLAIDHSKTTSKVTMKVFLTCPEDMFIRQFDHQLENTLETHRCTPGYLLIMMQDSTALAAVMKLIHFRKVKCRVRLQTTLLYNISTVHDYEMLSCFMMGWIFLFILQNIIRLQKKAQAVKKWESYRKDSQWINRDSHRFAILANLADIGLHR